jgi:hypothetical protein
MQPAWRFEAVHEFRADPPQHEAGKRDARDLFFDSKREARRQAASATTPSRYLA